MWNVVIFCLIVATFSGIYFINKNKISKIDREITYNKKKLKELKSLRIQLKTFQAKKKLFKTKFKIIKELENFKLLPPYLMSILAENIPEKVWLRSLKEDNFKISLKGVAIDEPTIVSFIKNLKKTGSFSRVELIQVSQVSYSGYKFKYFSLKMNINQTKLKDIL
jgi:type IV pilus assembly protein PilN